jgi:methylated-DNA-[protein]-cysteine S-methyltransferase
MNTNIYVYEFESPLGDLLLGEWNEALILCDWKYRKMRKAIDDRIKNFTKSNYTMIDQQDVDKYAVISQCISQLTEYFSKSRTAFDLPLHFAGSPFQINVWNRLLEIPFGRTLTYLELSKNLGNEKAIRAAASANGANAISIIVPCHRVIGSDGKLIGYAGGLLAKQKLLNIENINSNGQLSLFSNEFEN